MPVLEDPRHELYCQERASGRRIIDAYVAAGFPRDTGNATNFNARPNIQARVVEILTAAADRVEITQARVMAELGRIGFSDIRKLFTEGGTLKPVQDLDDDSAAFVSSIKVVTRRVQDGERGETEQVAEIKQWDKLSALEKIGKHIGMFKEAAVEPPNINLVIGDQELARLICFQLTKAAKEA